MPPGGGLGGGWRRSALSEVSGVHQARVFKKKKQGSRVEGERWWSLHPGSRHHPREEREAMELRPEHLAAGPVCAPQTQTAWVTPSAAPRPSELSLGCFPCCPRARAREENQSVWRGVGGEADGEAAFSRPPCPAVQGGVLRPQWKSDSWFERLVTHSPDRQDACCSSVRGHLLYSSRKVPLGLQPLLGPPALMWVPACGQGPRSLGRPGRGQRQPRGNHFQPREALHGPGGWGKVRTCYVCQDMTHWGHPTTMSAHETS